MWAILVSSYVTFDYFGVSPHSYLIHCIFYHFIIMTFKSSISWPLEIIWSWLQNTRILFKNNLFQSFQFCLRSQFSALKAVGSPPQYRLDNVGLWAIDQSTDTECSLFHLQPYIQVRGAQENQISQDGENSLFQINPGQGRTREWWVCDCQNLDISETKFSRFWKKSHPGLHQV